MGFIYKIENKLNHKVYIGQTKRTIQERWKEHLEMHRPQLPLYRAFSKYGINNFFVEEIEECDNSLLDEREIYWIAFYDSFNCGYNATLGGSSAYRINYNEVVEDFLQTKNVKLTAENLGCNPATVRLILNLSNIEHKVEVPIEMLDPETLSVIKTFKSITEAAQYQPSWNIGTISSAVTGSRNSAYGYFWRKQGDFSKNFKPLFKQNRKIGQYDKNNQFIQSFNSIAEANRSLNKPQYSKNIGNVLGGRAKTAYGYIWKYLD